MNYYLMQTNQGDNAYEIELDEKEWREVNDLIKELRAKKEREKQIQNCKNSISGAIADSISRIGIEETKRIVRDLNRELRGLGE